MVHLDDPQTWNMYSYVRNNPLTDPLGLDPPQQAGDSAGGNKGGPAPDTNMQTACTEGGPNKRDCDGQTSGGSQMTDRQFQDALNMFANAVLGVFGVFLEGSGGSTGEVGNAADESEGAAPVLGTETVQRAMSNEELEATKSTGLLRGGREGENFVSDAVNSDPLRARQRLSLDRTPDVRVTMKVPAGKFSASSVVDPKYNVPGGGTERSEIGQIVVTILNVFRYGPGQ